MVQRLKKWWPARWRELKKVALAQRCHLPWYFLLGAGGGVIWPCSDLNLSQIRFTNIIIFGKSNLQFESKDDFHISLCCKNYVSRKPLLYRVNLKDVQLLRFFNCNLSETRQAFLTWFLCVKMFSVRLDHLIFFLDEKPYMFYFLEYRARGIQIRGVKQCSRLSSTSLYQSWALKAKLLWSFQPSKYFV